MIEIGSNLTFTIFIVAVIIGATIVARAYFKNH
jgi:hypothetical protein